MWDWGGHFRVHASIMESPCLLRAMPAPLHHEVVAASAASNHFKSQNDSMDRAYCKPLCCSYDTGLQEKPFIFAAMVAVIAISVLRGLILPSSSGRTI